MTIRLLLSLAILLVPLSVQAQDHKYVGARKCRSCHKKEEIGNQYGIWLESKHAKAFETLATEKAREWAAKEGIEDPQTADECLKCHATAHGVPDDRLSMKFDRTAGVQCESCHGAGKDYSKKKVTGLTLSRPSRPSPTRCPRATIHLRGVQTRHARLSYCSRRSVNRRM
jgi:hypothetical protein